VPVGSRRAMGCALRQRRPDGELPAAAWIRLAVVTAAVLVHHGYTRDHWASVVGDDAKVVDGGSDCAGGTARSGELTVDLLVDDKPGTIRIL
jgi:hypothetical protein